jgi:hypothetical protein
MNSRRETLLLVAFAVWGLAIAISLAPALQRPAPPDQLPGYATQIGIDAHGPFRFFALLIVVTLFTPLIARPLARRLATGEAWASNATIAACIVAFWFVLLERNPFYVITPFAIAIAAFTLLRRVPMHFTRRDWILLPTFLTTLLAVIDVVKDIQVQRATLVAAAIVLAIRIAVTFLPSPLPPALAFLVAPLGLALQTGFFARDQRYFGWHALVLVVITPFVLRLVLRNERRAVRALTFLIYPIALYAYTNAMSITTAEGKARMNFFEDSHSLPIASEYLRGELPYRDNLPVHGLGADGGFEYLAFRLTGASAGNAIRAWVVVATLNSIAIYALGAALTGAAEVGLVAFFFATLTASTSSMVRASPALFTLLLIVLAIRKRDSRYFIAAGAGAVLCGVEALDFGLYTFLILLIAAFRMRALRAVALGVGVATALLFSVLAVFGILDDFFRSTFGEVLSMGPAYALNLFTPPRDLTSFPELLPMFFRGDAFPYFAWCGIAIATAVLLARRRRRSREAFVIVGLWVVLCAISYAERHHLYFIDLIAPLLVGGTFVALRKRAAFAPALVLALLIAAMPTTHIGILGWVRRLRGPAEKRWVEVPDVPRARGVLILDHEAADLAAVKKYASLALKPDETWFDFTNRAIFYYLLNRDNPTRYVEVAYYQSETAQREVIATLERNPHIRAALVPPGGTAVDGVPHELRTPLVWQYLQEHFTPDFAEGGVVFWRRR